MKQTLIAVLALLLIANFAMAQGTSLYTGGTQGISSGMAGGPHDFTATATDSIGMKLIGPTNFLCGYCHVPHVTSTGVTGPLWARKSLVTGTTHAGITFGKYASQTMDATVNDVNATDNYSSFCLSCHDGSMMFASSAYASKPVPYSAGWPGVGSVPHGIDTVKVPSYMSMATTGSYGGLNHIHPVNFIYPTTDAGLYTPQTATYAYLDGTYGAVGRLFPDATGANSTVQCSSCHNPHINDALAPSGSGSYPLIEGTLDGGALCVSCHKK